MELDHNVMLAAAPAISFFVVALVAFGVAHYRAYRRTIK